LFPKILLTPYCGGCGLLPRHFSALVGDHDIGGGWSIPVPRRQAVFIMQDRRRDDWWRFDDGRRHTAELPFAVPTNQQAD
jgi:hypothetical protein